MKRRNTIQKVLILEAVRTLHQHATADEVYSFVVSKYPSVSKGTVYRNLEILAQEGQIKKIDNLNDACRFDHLTHKHHHIKCDKCNKIFDVEISVEDDFSKKVKKPSGFDFTDYDIIFKGVCPDCKKKSVRTKK